MSLGVSELVAISFLLKKCKKTLLCELEDVNKVNDSMNVDLLLNTMAS